VTWNAEPTLAGCLAAIAASRPGSPDQVICVDNHSVDESVAVARSLGVQVLELASNVGFPKAVNAAIPHCRSEYVLLLNPDVVVEPDTIERSIEALRANDGIGLIGANLRQPDGRADLAAARRFRTLGLLFVETFGLTRLSRRLDRQYLPEWDRTTSRDVPCINGAFALLRTELLRQLGGLDETAFLYLEDQELCRRVWAHGLRVRFVAEARAVHAVSAATRAARPDQQAVAYLHRIDASVEIIRRVQGEAQARVALALWAIRVLLGLAGSILRRELVLAQRYRTALQWLAQQVRRRQPPPPVPG
jgi:hypothetical protein